MVEVDSPFGISLQLQAGGSLTNPEELLGGCMYSCVLHFIFLAAHFIGGNSLNSGVGGGVSETVCSIRNGASNICNATAGPLCGCFPLPFFAGFPAGTAAVPNPPNAVPPRASPPADCRSVSDNFSTPELQVY